MLVIENRLERETTNQISSFKWSLPSVVLSHELSSLSRITSSRVTSSLISNLFKIEIKRRVTVRVIREEERE